MRFLPERGDRPAPPPAPHLVEIVTPRTSAATITPAENLFAAVALAEPLAFEVTADNRSRRFLGRAASPAVWAHLEAQLGAAYPQAVVRPLDARADPSVDPAWQRPGEQVAACTLSLRAAAYLPIRMFRDEDVDATRSAQADPVLGILQALGDLPAGWRALSQLALRPAPEDWSRPFLRLAVQHPLAGEQAQAPAESATPGLFFLVGLLAAALGGLQAYHWWLARQWPQLAIALPAAIVGALALVLLVRRWNTRPMYDMTLVREKVGRFAYYTEIRLSVFAPADSPPAAVQQRLNKLVAAYRHYTLADGNGFVARPLNPARRRQQRGLNLDLRTPAPLTPHRRLPMLNTRELAGLWHLPQGTADVPLLERTTARRWLPLPTTVAHGCRIGVSAHHGCAVPVALPEHLLRRHLLLVAKTRRGKSTLMLRLAGHAMASRTGQSLLLIDPHRDLAESTLGMVPPHRHADVVYLDVADDARPFGLNLLDTGLGWRRDRAVANALTIFQREWQQFWGPRMEDAFRFALATLFEANLAICAADPEHGRARQHTILEVEPLLTDPVFRRTVLAGIADASLMGWWSGYFEPLDRRFQLEIVNPVLSKIHRFEGSRAARAIVGQACSTVDPAEWLRRGAIVVVNTAKGVVGENTAALVGATVMNLVGLTVAEQARLDPSQRRAVTVLVDEFHTMPGADYESMLAELAKYGANVVLATQSLARLAALDGEQGRALRATVFANLDGLFAFHCSAEDAQYLVPELGGSLDEQDLTELGEHQCYVRMSHNGERLPTFSVALDGPPATDAAAAADVARMSAARYGRDRAQVEQERQAAIARRRPTETPSSTSSPGPAQPPAAPSRRRNEHRSRQRSRKAPITLAPSEAEPASEPAEAM